MIPPILLATTANSCSYYRTILQQDTNFRATANASPFPSLLACLWATSGPCAKGISSAAREGGECFPLATPKNLHPTFNPEKR